MMEKLEFTAPFAQSLAARLARPLVFYDLEHTGGTVDSRGVTELACIVVTPSQVDIGLNTLINPGPDVTFNPFVTRITGINRKMVAKKPDWPTACADFVFAHEESVWCGFNSRSCDAKVIRAEHRRFRLREPGFRYQLDVMRLARSSGRSGNLSQLTAAHAPHASTLAHRALGDAIMTLALFEALSADIDESFLENEELNTPYSSIPAAKTRISHSPQTPASRRGQPWTADESESVRAAFLAQTPVEDIAAGAQRSAYAIAVHLVRHGLMREEDAAVFKTAPNTSDTSTKEQTAAVQAVPDSSDPCSRAYPNQGAKWATSEIQQLETMWNKDLKMLEEISLALGRTPSGIAANLSKLLGIDRDIVRAENTKRKRAMIPSEDYLRC